MNPFVGGIVIGLGGIWLSMVAWTLYIDRSGIDLGNVILRPGDWADPTKRQAAHERSMAIQHRQAQFARRYWWIGASLVVVGVLVAVL